MSMKINRLEIENVKRIKAVKLEPAQNGLSSCFATFFPPDATIKQKEE